MSKRLKKADCCQHSTAEILPSLSRPVPLVLQWRFGSCRVLCRPPACRAIPDSLLLKFKPGYETTSIRRRSITRRLFATEGLRTWVESFTSETCHSRSARPSLKHCPHEPVLSTRST